MSNQTFGGVDPSNMINEMVSEINSTMAPTTIPTAPEGFNSVPPTFNQQTPPGQITSPPPIQTIQEPTPPGQITSTPPIQTIQEPTPPVMEQPNNIQTIQEPTPPVMNQSSVQETQQQQTIQEPTQQQQTQQSPLESVTESFTPNVEDKKIIAVISPADYDNMIKILQVLTKENTSDSITIKQSNIRQGQTDCIIEANIEKVLKNKNGSFVDLDIINPKKYIKLLEQFKSQDDIYIIQDNENSRFIVTNGEVRLFLPKQDESIVQQETQSFDMTDAALICEFEIDKDIRKIIKNLSKDQEYIDYLIQDNMVKAIHIPDTAIYTFPNYKNDEKAQKLDETNADLSLRVSSFLPIDAENYKVYIVKMNTGKYASMSDCHSGKIGVRATEVCDLATGGNLLF